jgi:hypothetical protein
MGEGEGERVKECKSKLECNHPLSLTLPHRGERKKQITLFPIFLFFFFFKDRRFYLCKKK